MQINSTNNSSLNPNNYHDILSETFIPVLSLRNVNLTLINF